MKSYEKQLAEFGYEIADEIIKKEEDYKYLTFPYNFTIGAIKSVKFHEALNETT